MSKESENTNDHNESKGFGLPEGYFNDFSANVLNRIDWIKEHKDYPLLEKMKGDHGFTVPENYFEELESRSELLLYPQLSGIKKQNNFSVPDQYFEQSEELLNVSNSDEAFKVLSVIQKTNSFGVPENYFTTSAEKINEKLSVKAKVIHLFNTKTGYTSAAALLVITLGVWLFSHYFQSTEKDCGSLACIDKSELMKSKNLENVETDELYEVIDTKKLEENLNETKKEDKKSVDSSLQISTDDLPDEI